MKDMLDNATNITVANKVDAFVEGTGLPTHPTKPEWHTECVLISKCQRWLKQHPMTYRLQPCGSTSRSSMDRGYLKVVENGLVEDTYEVYLHQLLCYMYHGPAPGGTEVGHRCEHKTCICPWHLLWVTASANAIGRESKKKRKWAELV